jgi:4'-phosphopantetheinyl transferase
MPSANTVDLWWIDLERTSLEIADAREVLSGAERQRAISFRTDALSRRFVLRRAARRMILGRYAGQAAQAVEFEEGPQGKPSVSGSDVHMSASHSGDLAVIAVAGQPIGVDVEMIKPLSDMDALARQICAPSEMMRLQNVSDPTDEFYRFWVQKEAAVKHVGLGLSADLTSVVANENAQTRYGQITELSAPAGYAAALAATTRCIPHSRDFEAEIL